MMLPVFRTFNKHPLLLQLLAYEVAEFRGGPGDFDSWKTANSDFNPFGMPLVQVQSHVLEHALRGISAAELRTLHIIAGFRMPASIDTLQGLLIRTSAEEHRNERPFNGFHDLDTALTSLEDRGLLGWDRHANRYDLHPIVRGVVWNGLDDTTRKGLYSTLRSHFASMPAAANAAEIESLDDLAPAIELYNTLIGLKLYDEALQVFQERLESATHYRLSVSHLRMELLEALFPEGLEVAPRLSTPRLCSYTMVSLALAYKRSGNLHAAISLNRRAANIDLDEGDMHNHGIALQNLSDALRFTGHFREAEALIRAVILIRRGEEGEKKREADCLHNLGLVLINRGASDEAETAFQRSLRIWSAQGYGQAVGVLVSARGEVALRNGHAMAAKTAADLAWKLASYYRHARDLIYASRLQGTAALALHDYATAAERLHRALLNARAVSLVEEALPSLVALADLHRLTGETTQARSTLDDVWNGAERGPYPMFHADAINVLAQIERDEGNRDAAVEAATKAYQLAWCDGPPYAYHWGLEKAKAHLAALGAPEPEMPPFDESKYEPMPEVEINPPDEFGGEDEPDAEA